MCSNRIVSCSTRSVVSAPLAPVEHNREICRFFDGWPGERVNERVAKFENAKSGTRTGCRQPGPEQSRAPGRFWRQGRLSILCCFFLHKRQKTSKMDRNRSHFELGAHASSAIFGGGFASRSRVRLAMKCQLKSTTKFFSITSFGREGI